MGVSQMKGHNVKNDIFEQILAFKATEKRHKSMREYDGRVLRHLCGMCIYFGDNFFQRN